jgi:transcriptional regulator with XRE-family HTH domain
MVGNLRTAANSVSPRFMVTASQLRAARALLGWSRAELSKRSGVGAPTITDFELKGADARQGTVQKWVTALAKEGVEFTSETDEAGCGVRFRRGWPKGKKVKE